MVRIGAFALWFLVACGSVGPEANAPLDGGSDGPPTTDAQPGGRCDPAAPFQAPTLVPGINTSFDETGLSLTRDELVAFVGRTIQGSDQLLRVATRASISGDFSPATTDPMLAALNKEAGSEYGATTSADGLLLYFRRQAASVIGIELATRPDPRQPFAASQPVSVDRSTLVDALTPHLSTDGQTLYWLDFAVFRLHQAQRNNQPSSFAGARDASSIDNVYNPVLSADETTLYWSNGMGDDILVSTRADRGGTFGTGAPLDGVNSADDDWPVFLTEDGCTLYLASSRPGGLGGMDIWVARRGSQAVR
jgi:hypothetical protein